ncbi:MAG: hypothetical protein QOI95_307 [Acidimicrobiaceae bacterium]|jgi:hypothetical protein
MRVLLLSAVSERVGPTQLDKFLELAKLDRVGRHRLTDVTSDADIVLFVDLHLLSWRMKELTAHPVRLACRDRAFAYCDRDRPWCVLPGVYVSMPSRSFRQRWQRPWLYHTTPVEIDRCDHPSEPDLLFSFVGGRTHPCRDQLLRLRHLRGFVDDSTGFMFHDPTSRDFEHRLLHFRELLFRSKFVICPRGHGVTSYRLVETLAAGRVPVIISDDWVAPSGIDWDGCAIRVREDSLSTLPALLEERERDYAALSRSATAVYDAYFRPEVTFDQIVERCVEIRAQGGVSSFPLHGQRDREWLRLSAAHALGAARGIVHVASRRARGTDGV